MNTNRYLSASLFFFFFPIYYLTGHSTSNQAEIDVTSAPRRNLDLHAQSLVLEIESHQHTCYKSCLAFVRYFFFVIKSN
ncbi:hypothetical protein llap_21358 [Limosa lapponica baueri]|uniref:Uncharacterized protein n=1 Tax=Limosa lapponica baueri TaxID=1758121 RepID=A0A2I0T3I0_LIMLA|nr:hypothetical protein llap_21358 [Limosa lapponica baueri]